MTLEAFSPDYLDEMALQALDLAAALRNMAKSCREHEMPYVELHSGKAAEWMGHLEKWSTQSTAKVEMAVIQQRGVKKARQKPKKKKKRS